MRARCLWSVVLCLLPLAAETVPADLQGPLGVDPAHAGPLVQLADFSAGKRSAQGLTFGKVWGLNAGNDRWLWRVDLVPPVDAAGSLTILYLDADHDPATGRQDKPEVRGTDIMYAFGATVQETVPNPALKQARGATRARALLTDTALYLGDDLPLATDGADAVFRFRLLSQRTGGGGDSTDWVDARLPRVKLAALPEISRPTGLSYHGLPRGAVEPSQPRLKFERERPAVPFRREGVAKPATVEREAVPVELLEEHGRARAAAPLRFGCPFPQGAVFDPRNVAVRLKGQPLAADLAVTSTWPDGSLRWVLIDTTAPLAAGERTTLSVEYGRAVQRPAGTPMACVAGADGLTVDTGAVRCELTTNPLRLRRLTAGGKTILEHAAFRLTDGKDAVYEPREAKATVEYAGDRRLDLRFEAPYAGADGKRWFRAIVRLSFHRDSPAIELSHTLIDDHLDWEFAELKTLRLELPAAGGDGRFLLGGDEAAPRAVAGQALAVPHDQAYWLDGKLTQGRTVGVADASNPAGQGLSVAVVDFWQRYPKGLALSADRLVVDLFPALDGPANPGTLPENVGFPYVQGQYRFKWGTATTDRLVLVPHAGDRDAALATALDAVQTIVPVVPAGYYERTGALGELAAADGRLYRAWDEQFAKAFALHRRRQDEGREYGFANWGDWYGERGENWGNNEYDLPHGLFMQFARTGRREYARLALAGVRHQADMDMIHAYPDPLYVGGNLLHSYDHTGEWSEGIAKRQWSFPYGYHAAAWNGHTWASGMCDSWYLDGDPVVMEATLGLGEHIAWQMSREFRELGTHERSAGWSGHAIADIYRATGDPEYLKALDRILAVAYREQKHDDGGAWPHLLPEDHAGGVPGARGNVSFLIGVLLEAIDDQWHLAPSDTAKRSMIDATGWLRTQWIPELGVFQYTSSPTFRANATHGGATLNPLIEGPMLQVAEWTGDDALLRLGTEGFLATTKYGFDSFGKSMAQVAHFAPQIMARLKRLGADRKPYGEGLALSGEELQLRGLAAVQGLAELRLRGPDDKLVWFRHAGGAVTFRAVRTAWGSKVKGQATGTIRLLGPGSRVLRTDTFSTDAAPWTFTVTLPADAPAGDYRVAISDDQRGRWDVTGPAKRVVPTKPEPQFGGMGEARWYFRVPAGTKDFQVGLGAVHAGPFGLVVYDPHGKPAAHVADEASGYQSGKRASLAVTVPAGTPDRVWSVVAYAGMDAQLSLTGVPPYLATSADGWFEPGR